MSSKEKQLQSEQKQIAKLEKQKAWTPYKGYLMILLILLALVHVLDNYTSEIVGSIQSHIVSDFFVIGMGMDSASAYSSHTLITTALSFISIFAAFYKGLADRFGRKVFFFISAFGMGLGMLLIFSAQDIVVYTIGRVIISFFVATDMQVLYITEIAPANKRGLYFSIACFIASLGNLLIPVMRSSFIGETGAGWRYCFLVPGTIGICLAVMVLIFVKESKVWVDKRLAVLNTPLEVREAEKKAKKVDASKTGVFVALKEIMRSKQLLAIFFSYVVMSSATMFLVMYTEPILQGAQYTEAGITAFYVTYPIMGAVINLINGPISDKIGRKKGCTIFGALTVVGFLGFILGAKAIWNAYLLGAIYGLSITSFWATLNTAVMMISESAPTRIRSSVTGAMSLAGLVVSTVVSIVLSTLIGSGLDMSWTCFGGGMILTGTGLVVMMIFTKETAGNELD